MKTINKFLNERLNMTLHQKDVVVKNKRELQEIINHSDEDADLNHLDVSMLQICQNCLKVQVLTVISVNGMCLM